MTNPESSPDLTSLESNIGDLIGQLHVLAKEQDDPEVRMKGLSHIAKVQEIRRHHMQREHDGRVAAKMQSEGVSALADKLEGALKLWEERSAPADKDVVRYRGMGIRLDLVGKRGDAGFDAMERMAKVMAENHGSLKNLLVTQDARERVDEGLERSARRKVEDIIGLAIESMSTLADPISPDEAKTFLQGLRTKLEGAFEPE